MKFIKKISSSLFLGLFLLAGTFVIQVEKVSAADISGSLIYHLDNATVGTTVPINEQDIVSFLPSTQIGAADIVFNFPAGTLLSNTLTDYTIQQINNPAAGCIDGVKSSPVSVYVFTSPTVSQITFNAHSNSFSSGCDIGSNNGLGTIYIRTADPSTGVITHSQTATENGTLSVEIFTDIFLPPLDSGSLDNITLIAGAADQLVFGAEDMDHVYGSEVPEFTVRITDEFGNTILSDNATEITLSVATGTGNISFGENQTVSEGVAIFDQVFISQAGEKTLDADADGPLLGVSNSFTVSPKPLTLVDVTAQNKVYDGTTSAIVNFDLASLTGGIVGFDAVWFDGTSAVAVFDTPEVGNNKTVTITGVILTDSHASNYTLEPITTTANITKAPSNRGSVGAGFINCTATVTTFCRPTTVSVQNPSTREELEALVAQLTAQLAVLTGTQSMNLITNLRQGSTGTAVVNLQICLNNQGHNAGTPDGKFGPMTYRAVIAFQNAQGLLSDGIVGPQTNTKLSALCS